MSVVGEVEFVIALTAVFFEFVPEKIVVISRKTVHEFVDA